MELKAKIEELVNANLESEKHFLVDVIITATKGPKKLLILIDGDEGINIDDCAKMSRVIGSIIEEKELIEDTYRLEVSSPGLDHPLLILRQYIKNIGRQVKVTLNDGKVVKGKLQQANNNQLVVEEALKKETKILTLLFKDIKKTEVQVTF